MRIAALVTSLFLFACQRGAKDPAACEVVGQRFLDLAHRQVDDAVAAHTADEAARNAVSSHIPAMRDSIVRACHEGNWSAETRGCFAAATDATAMETCYQSMPPDQRALLDKASAPEE